MKFRKKPVVIDAFQWFKNDGHPEDGASGIEGEIVHYYRHPSGDGERTCDKCNFKMLAHGWIDTLEGAHIVCPGDWIITGIDGKHFPCKPDSFNQTYERVE